MPLQPLHGYHSWEAKTTCPECGGEVYASGISPDDPQNGIFEDRKALCYRCGAHFTVELRTGDKATTANDEV